MKPKTVIKTKRTDETTDRSDQDERRRLYESIAQGNAFADVEARAADRTWGRVGYSGAIAR